MPYIPGSELKGAIRTALLYNAIQDDQHIQSWLESELKNFQKRNDDNIRLVANERDLRKPCPNNQRQKLSKLKEWLSKEIARLSAQLEGRVLCCKPDAKYDVMKFLQIGDSELINSTAALSAGPAKPFNISGFQFTIFYELLRPSFVVPLTSFKLEADHSRHKKLKEMEFTASHKQLMSGLDKVLAYCHRFSSDLLQEEIDFFNKHGKHSVVEHLKVIRNVNTPESPVLRIGKDEGFTSLTVGLAVKKLMPELYETVLIHATKNKSYDSKHGGPFPKSRKLVHWEGKELTAGWVQLIADAKGEEGSREERAEESPKQGGQDPAAPIDLSVLKSSQYFKRKK